LILSSVHISRVSFACVSSAPLLPFLSLALSLSLSLSRSLVVFPCIASMKRPSDSLSTLLRIRQFLCPLALALLSSRFLHASSRLGRLMYYAYSRYLSITQRFSYAASVYFHPHYDASSSLSLVCARGRFFSLAPSRPTRRSVRARDLSRPPFLCPSLFRIFRSPSVTRGWP